MHLPDGFISGSLNSVTAAISAVALALSVRRIKSELRDKDFAVPLLATTAAFVFAAQMLNFPIGGGTSGHFLGAAAVAALLGPWAACLVMAIVLVLQCLFFADGGLLALGSNILNMGIVGGIAVYPLMRGLRVLLPRGRVGFLVSAAVASWVGVVLASVFCAFELALSGTSPLGVVLPVMAGTHIIIGIGEALITAVVLSAVATARPDIVPVWARLDARTGELNINVWILAVAGFVLAVGLVLFVSPFASTLPDGLDKAAEDCGFAAAAKTVWTRALFPEYTGIGGLTGTVLAFAAGLGVIRLVGRKG